MRLRFSGSVLSTTAWVVIALLFQVHEARPQQGGLTKTYSVLTADKNLIPLPSVSGVSKSKVKALGMGGSKATVPIPGEAATVRLKSGDAHLFIVTVQHGTMQELLQLSTQMPVVQLHKLNVNKGTREWVISDTKSYVVTARSTIDVKGVPVNVSQYGSAPDSIQVEPRSPLASGEYAFVTVETDAYQGTSYRFYCFGVD